MDCDSWYCQLVLGVEFSSHTRNIEHYEWEAGEER